MLPQPTRREQFLSEMDKVVPSDQLCALIEPYYPKAGNGRRAGADAAYLFSRLRRCKWSPTRNHGVRVVGIIQLGTDQITRCDLYPAGSGDGVLDISDLILLQRPIFDQP